MKHPIRFFMVLFLLLTLTACAGGTQSAASGEDVAPGTESSTSAGAHTSSVPAGEPLPGEEGDGAPEQEASSGEASPPGRTAGTPWKRPSPVHKSAGSDRKKTSLPKLPPHPAAVTPPPRRAPHPLRQTAPPGKGPVRRLPGRLIPHRKNGRKQKLWIRIRFMSLWGAPSFSPPSRRTRGPRR